MSPAAKNKPRAEKSKELIAYAAFLRGINVGGNHLVKMEDLRRIFEAMGFSDVKTILASGNVVFKSGETDAEKLPGKIRDALKKKLGHDVEIIVRAIDALKEIAAANPFAGFDSEAKYYVTFLPASAVVKLTVPHVSPGKDFQVCRATKTEVFSVCFPSADNAATTTGLMLVLDKGVGKGVTTRNWNTVLKIIK